MGGLAGCGLRFSSASVATVSMTVAAIAELLPTGAPLYIYGNVNEGCVLHKLNAILLQQPKTTKTTTTSTTTTTTTTPKTKTNIATNDTKPANKDSRSSSNSKSDRQFGPLELVQTDTTVVRDATGGPPIVCRSNLFVAYRQERPALSERGNRTGIEAWGEQQSLSLIEHALPNWTTYPGLFAGGTLDVMTEALLRTATPLPPKGRVLDFACGSGCIAASLKARSPSLRLHLLDGDTVALHAARSNVPNAAGYHLANGWKEPESPTLAEGSHKFRWIISNPPVHAGQPDDFRVVLDLITGAASRLKEGGLLWLVAQEQIPVGRLFAIAQADHRQRSSSSSVYSYSDVTALRPASGQGRFVVWRATAGPISIGTNDITTTAATTTPIADPNETAGADEDNDERENGQPPKKKRKKQKKSTTTE